MVNVEIKNAPGEPGCDADEAVAALTAVARRGRLDRPGGRLLVPRGHAAGGRRRPTPGWPLGWLLGLAADAGAGSAEAVERGFQAMHPFVTPVDARPGGRGPRRRAWP